MILLEDMTLSHTHPQVLTRIPQGERQDTRITQTGAERDEGAERERRGRERDEGTQKEVFTK